MDSLAEIQSRLTNIRSVLPILSALRTISLGSWQTAQRQRRVQQSYEAGLLAMLAQLWPRLRADTLPDQSFVRVKREVVILIGSERGLCGRFNSGLVPSLKQHLDERARRGQQVTALAWGSRLGRLLQRQGFVDRMTHLPKTAPALKRLAFLQTRTWLAAYEACQWDAIDLIYNTYHGLGRYQPTTVRLIPPRLPMMESQSAESLGFPPIIETDPHALFEQIVEQWIALKFYGVLLESATAEHSARYQLMEAANQNAERLVDELTVAVQTARRQAITAETQALAVGAGLLEAGLG